MTLRDFLPAMWETPFEKNKQRLQRFFDEVGSETASIVGVNPTDESQLVYYDYDSIGTNMRLAAERRGSGKTVMAELMAALAALQDQPVVVHAPTNEYESQLQPQTDHDAVQALEKVDFLPMTLPIETYQVTEPAQNGFSLPDPFSLDFSLQEREDLMSSILDVKSDAQELAVARSLINNPVNLEAFAQAYNLYKEKSSADRESVGQIQKMIDDLGRRNVFSGQKVDFKQRLLDGKVLNFVGKMSGRSGVLSQFVSMYFSLAITKWRKDQTIPKTLTIREEAGMFLKTKQGQELVSEEITQDRKTGKSMLYIVQDLSMLTKGEVLYEALQSSAIIIAAGMPGQQLETIFEARGVWDDDQDKILNMPRGGKPPLHALIDPDGEVTIYKPLPCLGSLKKVI